MPVIQKAYMGPILNLASELQAVRRGAEAATAKFVQQEAKLSKQVLKIQQFNEEGGRVEDLHKRLDAKTKKVRLVKKDLEAK